MCGYDKKILKNTSDWGSLFHQETWAETFKSLSNCLNMALLEIVRWIIQKTLNGNHTIPLSTC